ncbi:MAG: hypothetical protein ACFCVK_12155 [Acidimicrobiales bacterium]
MTSTEPSVVTGDDNADLVSPDTYVRGMPHGGEARLRSNFIAGIKSLPITVS